ncbi:MAG: hypothetical protein ACXQTL_05590, partial [Methanosarcinales archaeon]
MKESRDSVQKCKSQEVLELDNLEHYEVVEGLTVADFLQMVKKCPEKLLKWGLIRKRSEKRE